MQELPSLPVSLIRGQHLYDYVIGEELTIRPGNTPIHVYRAHDPRTQQEVVLKVLALGYGQTDASDNTLTRFVREARIMQQLVHPHILPLLDVGHDEHNYWIVMPYCAKGSLAHYMGLRLYTPLPIHEACGYAIQMCQALEVAHSQVPPIIHRDIKPDNMLFHDNDQLMLTDFGIAHIMYEHHITQAGVTVGTPEFMAPEQLHIRSADAKEGIDPRLDIYALGCVLYALLCGHPPFVADMPIAIGIAHQHYAPKPLNLLNPQVTLGLALIVHKALKKDPAKRYPSAAAFAKALALFVEE